MNLLNSTGLPARYTMGLQPDGRQLLVVVVKGTFTLPPPGGEPGRAEVPAPLVDADVFTGEPGKSSTVYESDFAPRKPKCDLLLNGSAYAPGGVPADRVPVAFQVGPWRKSFDVVGDRAWVKSMMMVIATRPILFKSKTISYDTAFGGIDLSKEPHQYYPLNHAGLGYHVNLSADALTGTRLPNTEETGVHVSSPKGKYRPMAFGAIGRGWMPRAPLAGTYDKKWLDDVCPFLPADFKDEYYQSAPPDQQVAHLKGGEEVTLLNLTPDGRRKFRLPVIDVPVTFFRRDLEPVEVVPVIDTLIVEPDHGRFSMTWRCSLPLKKNVFEVTEILVGRKSKGWHRAPTIGKFYHASLAEAVRFPLRLTREEMKT